MHVAAACWALGTLHSGLGCGALVCVLALLWGVSACRLVTLGVCSCRMSKPHLFVTR
jgi:hypothetical protein